MTQTAPHRRLAAASYLMNTDGRRHPWQNNLAFTTLLLGGIAATTAIFPWLHLASSWFGLIGIITGLWGQLISATTAQRFVTVIGLGSAGLGCYLGLANGGLFG